MAKISFCVTYYNQEQYVDQSLGSIFALDMPCELEVLVGDDGSRDGTVGRVRQWQKKYPGQVQVFVMPREQERKYNPIHRASANRLNLAAHAVGEYIIFLDGDDWYCNTGFVQKALNPLEQHSDLIGCAFNFEYVSHETKKSAEQNLQTGRIDTNCYLLGKYIHSGAILFKNIFDDQKISELKKCKNFDDNLITIYMLQFGGLYYINEVLYSYRQSKQSIWNSASALEQNLLNSMDYEIISGVAPVFKNQLSRRQYNALKQVYKQKVELRRLLGEEKFQNYVDQNLELGNTFITALLQWPRLSIVKKICTQWAWCTIQYQVICDVVVKKLSAR